MKLKKVIWVIQRKLIGLINYISASKYMYLYNNYLRKIGVKISKGGAVYIDPSAHFDGVDYSIISIGRDVVISREVLLLTHDYAPLRALAAMGYDEEGRRDSNRLVKGISIGNNCFVGARAVLLPGTTLGDNVIVGAGAVVKGSVPAGVIVVGNPAKVIKNTKDFGEKVAKEKGLQM